MRALGVTVLRSWWVPTMSKWSVSYKICIQILSDYPLSLWLQRGKGMTIVIKARHMKDAEEQSGTRSREWKWKGRLTRRSTMLRKCEYEEGRRGISGLQSTAKASENGVCSRNKQKGGTWSLLLFILPSFSSQPQAPSPVPMEQGTLWHTISNQDRKARHRHVCRWSSRLYMKPRSLTAI